jgi:hypothetical protein
MRRGTCGGAARMTLRSASTFVSVTTPPPATPPPWRPKGYSDAESGDDPTLVDLPVPDPTVIQQRPRYPPPGPPPGPYGPVPPPPWPLVARRRRHGWLVGLLSCGGLLAGGVVALALLQPRIPAALRPPTTSATVASTTTIPPTTAPAIGASRDRPAPVGTEVVPAKGWTARVTGADLDADAEVAKAAWGFLRPERGKRFVLVTLDVGHQAANSSVLISEVKLALVAPSGATYSPTLNPTRDRFDIGEQWPPQGHKSGTVAFQVPRNEIAGSVLRVEPMFTIDGPRDQRFLALG